MIECLMMDQNLPFPCSDGTCAEEISNCTSLEICEIFKCFNGKCLESKSTKICGDLNVKSFQNQTRNVRLFMVSILFKKCLFD